jgi:hypothetical protein
MWWWSVGPMLVGCGGGGTVQPPVEPAPTGVPEPAPPPDDVDGPSTVTPTWLEPAVRPVASPIELVRRAVYPMAGGTLTHLAAPGGRWLLLEAGGETIHLEATAPIEVLQDGFYVGGEFCDLTGLPKEPAPWVPVCPNLWRREPTEGRKSRLEWGSDLVRDYVHGGEKITEVVKTQVVGDKYRQPATRIEALAEAARPGAPTPLPVTDRTVALLTPELACRSRAPPSA